MWKTKPISFFLLLILLAILIAVPLYAYQADEKFIFIFVTRALIFGLAALSLNLILGYGGMVSFGHALYMGLGAYSVGLMAHHGINNGWLQLVVMLVACGIVSCLTGLISFRTTGVAFIMITLAFSQMFYFLFVILKQYGGDDGLPLAKPSDFGFMNFSSPLTLYLVTFLLVLLVMVMTARLVKSPFGMSLNGLRQNERRMKSLGFNTTRIKLLSYMVSAMICGVAGMLYANLTGYMAPSYMAWSVSGELIVMVVLGGMATVSGPLIGAFALLLGEEFLKSYTEHWQLIMGPLVILVVLTAKRGLVGYANLWEKPKGQRASHE